MNIGVNDRDRSIDVLKGIGIISMVMGHSNMGETFELYIAGFHMQLFFIVSGFLFNPAKYNFAEFVKRKAKTLLLPYISFAVITLVFCVLINELRGTSVFDIQSSLKGLVYSNRAIFPITGAIWFLQCLFVSEIAMWCICRLFKGLWLLLPIILFVLVSWWQSVSGVWLPFAIDSAISATVFLSIGYCMRPVLNEVKEMATPKQACCGIILLGISAVMIFVNGQVNPRTCTYNQILFYYVNAIMGTLAWYFLAHLVCKMFKKTPETISEIGRNSIVYLGFNQLVIYVLYHFVSFCFVIESPLWKAARNIVICVTTMCILYVIKEVYNKTFLKYIIGKY